MFHSPLDVRQNHAISTIDVVNNLITMVQYILITIIKKLDFRIFFFNVQIPEEEDSSPIAIASSS